MFEEKLLDGLLDDVHGAFRTLHLRQNDTLFRSEQDLVVDLERGECQGILIEVNMHAGQMIGFILGLVFTSAVTDKRLSRWPSKAATVR
ncbi:hypothetical protein EFK68_04580 [Pseudomonas aeruginosa]|nr:hypothetical protein EFK68_04580 [Pseudomonas aeruginosa]